MHLFILCARNTLVIGLHSSTNLQTVGQPNYINKQDHVQFYIGLMVFMQREVILNFTIISEIQCFKISINKIYSKLINQGRIQDFKLGGAHLKKLRRTVGGAKIVEVFRVKNHDFTPNKSYFFQF